MSCCSGANSYKGSIVAKIAFDLYANHHKINNNTMHKEHCFTRCKGSFPFGTCGEIRLCNCLRL